MAPKEVPSKTTVAPNKGLWFSSKILPLRVPDTWLKPVKENVNSNSNNVFFIAYQN
jgi:hypothetical protein